MSALSYRVAPLVSLPTFQPGVVGPILSGSRSRSEARGRRSDSETRDRKPPPARRPVLHRLRVHHVPAHVPRQEERQGLGQTQETDERVHAVRQEVPSGADPAAPGEG